MKLVALKTLLMAGFLAGIFNSVGWTQEMRPPQLVSAKIDWTEALAALSTIPELGSGALSARERHARARANGSVPRSLARLNAAMATRFPGVAISPVPVLLPFDSVALIRDLENGTASEGNEAYLSGFQASRFFYPGPSGYDAVFSLRTGNVADFNDIKFSEPIDVLISGSSLLYELEDPTPAIGTPMPALESEYPGIRRLIHEHHLRYTFVRYGVPYVVSTSCFDAGVSRYRMPTCRAADRVLQHFLRALRVAGGTPKPPRIMEPLEIERPTEMSPTFSYHPPGRILPDSGFRGARGRADSTVYSQIRFPLAETPAFASSQMYASRNRQQASSQDGTANTLSPWRDNFCERRGFPVGQCPAGIGHQGQDISTPRCPPGPGGERCNADRNLVAVRDGAILRRPKQEAVYLFVNTASEHIRFRYLHMLPRKMDEDNLLSGRQVHEGEVIAQVGNFSKREGGTSYHLHFDLQVPTRDGWVFVNPYMTLVAAYERLIGGRGEVVADRVIAATADPATTGSSTSSPVHAEPKAVETETVEQPRRHQRVSKKRKHVKHAKHTKRGKYRVARR